MNRATFERAFRRRIGALLRLQAWALIRRNADGQPSPWLWRLNRRVQTEIGMLQCCCDRWWSLGHAPAIRVCNAWQRRGWRMRPGVNHAVLAALMDEVEPSVSGTGITSS